MTSGINNTPFFTPVFKSQSQRAKEDAARAAEEKEAREAEKKAQEEEKRKQELQERQNELSFLEEQLKNAKEQGEAVEDSFEAFGKCLTIAQRISRGDKVPLKDMKYLMEHEPDLYKQAIMLRQPNDKPKEYDSVLDEDDTENKTGENGNSHASESTAEIPAPVAEAAPAETASVEVSVE